MAFAHVFADLGGIPGDRLHDAQALGGLLLAAANAAGLSPAGAPTVQTGPRGVTAVLACHGGHVALHALPADGLCYADIASAGAGDPGRGLDVIVKRLGARDVRTDARRRGVNPHPLDAERI
jgi:S-adenosylmethionine/arginine decarboxylase-like enzyme